MKESILKVELLGHSTTVKEFDSPEFLVAAAAKLCYSKVGIDDIFDNLTPEKVSQSVKMLLDFGHDSPIEHVVFTFGIEGFSRVTAQQLTRHRIASYSMQSQRYVNLEETFEYIIPERIKKYPEIEKLFIEAMQSSHQNYSKISQMLKEKIIEEKNIAGKAAEKLAIEDARYVLPNACETKIIMTMNCRELMNFFKLRCCNRAQWEIRNIANQMLDLVLQIAPNIFAEAGPSCSFGKCSEGKMTCGRPIPPRESQIKIKQMNG